MVGAGLYFIDNIDIYLTYGAAILSGSYDSLFSYPKAKEPLQNDWFEYDGLDVDLTDRYFENIPVNIKFIIVSKNGISDLVSKRDGLVSLLNSSGYRSLRLGGYNVSFNIRYESSTSSSVFGFDNNGLIGVEIEAQFIMDDPLQMFKSTNGYAKYPSKFISSGNVFIDGINLKDYGMGVKGFSGSALSGDSMKDPLVLSFERLSGTISDCGVVPMKRKSKTIKLEIVALGDSIDKIISNYCSLFYDLKKSGHRVIYSNLIGKSFNCYYESQTDLSLTDMRLTSNLLIIEFSLNLKTIN